MSTVLSSVLGGLIGSLLAFLFLGAAGVLRKVRKGELTSEEVRVEMAWATVIAVCAVAVLFAGVGLNSLSVGPSLSDPAILAVAAGTMLIWLTPYPQKITRRVEKLYIKG